LQFAIAIIREKNQLAEDRSLFHISSSESSSTLDWFQNLQSTQQSSQCSQTELSKAASRPDYAVPSFRGTSAVPPPPTNIENLNLSQAFRSSQPAADSAYPSFRNNAERSDDFVSPFNDRVNRKDNNFADSSHPKAAMFKVPYKNTKPIAKVSRQETMSAASGGQLDSFQRETAHAGIYQVDNVSGLNNVDFNTDASQKPTLPEDNSNVVAKSPYFQPSFSGVGEFAARTPFPQHDISQSATASLRDHVGDTPFALSGM